MYMYIDRNSNFLFHHADPLHHRGEMEAGKVISCKRNGSCHT